MASRSGEVVTRPSGETSATQPITHSTSSAEYIATTIQRHKTGAVVMLALLLIVFVGGSFGLYKLGLEINDIVLIKDFR
jgi:hypothetical protein